jgi:hypothetical protein
MALTERIYQLFEAIATTHPTIGHDPNNGVIRFYGYNMDESNSGDVDNSTYPRLGLSTKTKANISGTYIFKSDTEKNFNFSVVLLDRVDSNDFTSEKNVYNNLESLSDDIVTWIQEVAHTKPECFGGIVSLFDLDNIRLQKIGPLGTANAHGWELTFSLQENFQYDPLLNPLNCLTPNINA